MRLFHGNGLNTVVISDFDRGQRKKLEGLYKAELLEKERIILATEIADQEEEDVEDFFTPELFSQIVNGTYELTGKNKLAAKKLMEADSKTVRLVKKAEAFFRILPDNIPMFSHYNPSYHLLNHPEVLDNDNAATKVTLDRFETLFETIRRQPNFSL